MQINGGIKFVKGAQIQQILAWGFQRVQQNWNKIIGGLNILLYLVKKSLCV